VTIDETRLQGAAKRLEDEIRSATKRRDAVASEIGRAEDRLHQLQQDRVSKHQLHQLQQDRVSEDQLHQSQQDRVRQTIARDRYERLTDDVRKQSEHSRKNVAELERKRALLALPTKISAAVPFVDQPNQEERREAELRSQDAELDATRIELEQNIKVLQQQKEELVKTNKSFQDQLDAAAANLSSIMEQVKTLDPDRREAVALQAQLEELNRQIDERRKMIDHLAKPAPRSRHVRPVPLGGTEQAPRGAR
jgi:chromosome segregation ATPase